MPGLSKKVTLAEAVVMMQVAKSCMTLKVINVRALRSLLALFDSIRINSLSIWFLIGSMCQTFFKFI